MKKKTQTTVANAFISYMDRLSKMRGLIGDASGIQHLRDDRRQGGIQSFFSDNLLVRIHLIIGMIWWTGLVAWE